MNLSEAANLLNKGNVVAFPTETVYGLGARWDHPEAIDQIFSLKGRPNDNPLIVHVSTREQQARRRAQATIAGWNAEDRLKQLQWSIAQLQQSAETRLDEQGLNDQGLRLSQRALDHELTRYREGLASYTDVQNRQQDFLDRQLAVLITRVELARELIELAYYRQWDWLSRLP
jgi:hypothetical protein